MCSRAAGRPIDFLLQCRESLKKGATPPKACCRGDSLAAKDAKTKQGGLRKILARGL